MTAGHAEAIPVYYPATGVWLFFVLSGYLLTGPMLEPQALHPLKIIAYLLRRIGRIYPAWLVLISVLTFFINDRNFPALSLSNPATIWFLDHESFRYSEGWLWTVKQEMVLYAILPFLIIAIAPLLRTPKICVGGLMLLAIACDFWLTENVISLTLNANVHQPLRLSPFLCGMAAIIFMTVFDCEHHAAKLWPRLTLCCLIALAITVPVFAKSISYNRPVFYGLIFAGIIIMAKTIKGGWIGLFLTQPRLAQLGIYGYGFYLWHFPCLIVAIIVLKQQGIENNLAIFLLTMLLATPLAAIEFKYIESPMISLSHRLARRLTYRHLKIASNIGRNDD